MTVFIPKGDQIRNDNFVRAEMVRRELEHENPHLVVLDVREPDEYAQWRIPDSVHIPIGQLENRLAELQLDGKQVVTVCAHGPRSTRAAQFLRERGYRAQTVAGGMVNGWNRVYDVVPVTTDVPDVEIFQLRRIGKGCVSYLVLSRGEAAAIDPTLDANVYQELAQRRGARIVAALDTHIHADHVSGGTLLAEAVDGYYTRLHLNTSLTVGGATISAIGTPGHTPESVSYRIGDVVLTGDTLFVESVGRPDLGQDPRTHAAILWDTIQWKLLSLPTGSRVLPGHYGEGVSIDPTTPTSASLQELKERLPALAMDREEFVEWIAGSNGVKPPNFETIKQINQREGVAAEDLDQLRDLEAGPNRCAVTEV